MPEEKIIKSFAIYNEKKHEIRSTRQTGRLNIFDWYGHAEEIKKNDEEEIIPVYIVIPDVLDE